MLIETSINLRSKDKRISRNCLRSVWWVILLPDPRLGWADCLMEVTDSKGNLSTETQTFYSSYKRNLVLLTA